MAYSVDVSVRDTAQRSTAVKTSLSTGLLLKVSTAPADAASDIPSVPSSPSANAHSGW
jgi:hypothetical protein